MLFVSQGAEKVESLIEVQQLTTSERLDYIVDILTPKHRPLRPWRSIRTFQNLSVRGGIHVNLEDDDVVVYQPEGYVWVVIWWRPMNPKIWTQRGVYHFRIVFHWKLNTMDPYIGWDSKSQILYIANGFVCTKMGYHAQMHFDIATIPI